MIATPYQVEDPDGDRAQARQGPRRLRGRRPRGARRPRARASPTSRARSTSPTAEQVRKLDLAGHRDCSPTAAASTRRASSPAQVIGTVGIDNQGLTGLEASEDDAAARHRRRARGRPRRARRRARARHDRRARRPARTCELTIDASLQAETEQVLAEDRPDLPARRARRRSSWTRARSEVLAMANWPGFDPTDPGERRRRTSSATWRPASPTSRARPSRRSRSPARSRRGWSRRDTMFDLPPTIQVADRDDRGVARARLRHASRSPTSSPSPRTSAR